MCLGGDRYMTILKSLKGKVAGTALIGALVVGGGAASASQFSDVAFPIVDSITTKAANLLGYQLNDHAEKKEKEVAKVVNDEFDAAAGAVIGTYNSEYARGTSEINTYATGYANDVKAFTAQEKAAAQVKLTNVTNSEVSSAKTEIHNAAIDKLKAKTAPYANITVPAKPAE